MSSEVTYNEIVHRIRVNRARLLIKYGKNESLYKSLSSKLNGIGKDADLRHSDGQLLDEVSERLDNFENSLLVVG